MASVFEYEKNGERFWAFRIYLGTDPATGKPRNTKRRGFTTKKAATQAATRMEYQKQRGELNKTNKGGFFKDISEEYWTAYVKTVRASTSDTVRVLVDKYVLPSLGKYKIDAITPAILQRSVGEWQKAMPALFTRAYNFVEATYKFAVSNDYTEKNPTQKIERPRAAKKTKSDEMLYWNREQIAKFFSCLDPEADREVYTMFRVLFMTGLRRGELLGLRWKNINLIPGQEAVTVDATLIIDGTLNPPKTESSYRTVPLYDGDAINSLKAWRREQRQVAEMHGYGCNQTDGFVFCAPDGKPHALSTLNRILSRTIEDNKLTPVITVHKARHSFISNMLIAGVPVPVVQKMVGHKTPTITLQVYSHVSMNEKEGAAETFANYVNFADIVDDSQNDSHVINMSDKRG